MQKFYSLFEMMVVVYGMLLLNILIENSENVEFFHIFLIFKFNFQIQSPNIFMKNKSNFLVIK